MNYIFIKELVDLKILLEAQLTTSIDKEYDILKNCWAISLDRAFSKKFTLSKLRIFYNMLIKKIKKAFLVSENPATFYMWFDRQAIQLRFNIIPKHIKKLPFDCSIKQISSPDQILEQFLNFSNRSQGLLIANIIELNNSIKTEEEDISYMLDVHMQYF